MGRDGQKQHADIHRKIVLRQQLLGDDLDNVADGAVYVPFCGDGDLTDALGYTDARQVWAADIDADRVATFRERFPDATVVEGDCNDWPFDDDHGDPPTFAIVDLDAYVYPYHAHRALFDNAPTADRIAVFYTDPQIQTIFRNGIWHDPDGTRRQVDDTNERRQVANRYWTSTILPWLHDEADRLGYHIADTFKYRRGMGMFYWGAIYDRQPATHPDHGHQDAHTDDNTGPPTDPTDDDRQAVTDALTEAAISGNVRAMIEWLDRNEPDRDPKKRRTPHGPPTYGLHGRAVYDDDKGHPRCTADAKSKLAAGATPHTPEARCGNRPIDGHWVCRNHGGSAEQTVRQAKLNLLDGVSPAISALVRPLQELERRAGLDLMYEGYLTDETLELARSLRKQSNDVLDRMGYPRRTEIDLAGAKARVLDRLNSLDDDTDDE